MDAVDYGYTCLAAAIIDQACEDYKVAWIVDDEKTCSSIERFFKSKYFSNISKIDPKWLIKNLREKYELKRKQRMMRVLESAKFKDDNGKACLVETGGTNKISGTGEIIQ